MQLPQIEPITAALSRLAERLESVDRESIAVSQSSGRVLAGPLLADRDSPAINVSAMDGFAVRREDLVAGTLPIAAVSPAGSVPLRLEPRTAIQIFTGGPVPLGADCVVKREDTDLSESHVQFRVSTDQIRIGQSIRRQGENARSGEVILSTGTLISPGSMAAIASFSAPSISVFRKLRVGLINTGDELVAAGQPVQPWQIRDSNGPTLESLLKQFSWIDVIFREQVVDSLEATQSALTRRLPLVDAILLTGGVSMGDSDFVPQAIEKIGGEIIFHRLPIRPGRPILGAVSSDAKLLMGLPGNPVSVAVTARRLALPLLRKLAGFANRDECVPLMTLTDSDSQTLDLIWYRLVHIDPRGHLRLVSTQGSGDLVSLSVSDGFIEVPPQSDGAGPYPFYRW